MHISKLSWKINCPANNYQQQTLLLLSNHTQAKHKKSLSLGCTAREWVSTPVKMKTLRATKLSTKCSQKKKMVKEHVQLRWKQMGGSILKVISTCQNFTKNWSIHSNTMSDGFFCFTISWQVPNSAYRCYLELHANSLKAMQDPTKHNHHWTTAWC